MKLVERLARELPEWPGSRIYSMEQASDGDVIYNLCHPPSLDDEDYEYSGKHMALAEDWSGTVVTRAQWEAERARIASTAYVEISDKDKEFVSSDFYREIVMAQKLKSVGDEADLSNDHQAQYDQELWDKAYMHAWTQMLSESAGSDMSHFNDGTAGSARMADAFMAERAKRVKKL